MYIKRKIFSLLEDENGEERLFSTTEFVNEDTYVEHLYSELEDEYEEERLYSKWSDLKEQLKGSAKRIKDEVADSPELKKAVKSAKYKAQRSSLEYADLTKKLVDRGVRDYKDAALTVGKHAPNVINKSKEALHNEVDRRVGKLNEKIRHGAIDLYKTADEAQKNIKGTRSSDIIRALYKR